MASRPGLTYAVIALSVMRGWLLTPHPSRPFTCIVYKHPRLAQAPATSFAGIWAALRAMDWDVMSGRLPCFCPTMSRMDPLWTGVTVALVSVGLT
jgi:hypothetical protein